ncbi:MAG: hypothetical protein K0R99_1300 [Microbacterium sp.]|nr:hypothetical protein [Microbacterium sp.]
MSKFFATAAASSAVPSEKVTSGFRSNVYSVASAFTVQSEAIHGSISSVSGFCHVRRAAMLLTMPPFG